MKVRILVLHIPSLGCRFWASESWPRPGWGERSAWGGERSAPSPAPSTAAWSRTRGPQLNNKGVLHQINKEQFECWNRPIISYYVFLLALQIKGRQESSINVWFLFMYSQKWNCAASLFPKQNYNVLYLSFHTHIQYLCEIYTFPGSVCLFCCSQICGPILGILYINRLQAHECMNWAWGRAIPFPCVTNPTSWHGFKCSEDAEIVLCSSRDGIHLKQEKATCRQDIFDPSQLSLDRTL